MLNAMTKHRPLLVFLALIALGLIVSTALAYVLFTTMENHTLAVLLHIVLSVAGWMAFFKLGGKE